MVNWNRCCKSRFVWLPGEVPRLFPDPGAKWFTYCRTGAWEPWSCLRPGEGFEVLCAVWAGVEMENAISSWCCSRLLQPCGNEQHCITPVTPELEVWKATVGGSARWTVQEQREIRRKTVHRRKKKKVVLFLESSGYWCAKRKKRFVQINSCRILINSFWIFTSDEN